MDDGKGRNVVRNGALAGVALIAVGYFLFGGTSRVPHEVEVNSISLPTQKISLTPGVERWYTNEARTFSFRLPDGYLAPEFETDVSGVWGVDVQNSEGLKLRILVVPVGKNYSVSPEELTSTIPNVEVRDVEDSFIATVVRGLSFRTNAPEWGGDGVGFWTAHNGYLYQLYAANDDKDLLDFVVANWYFAPPVPGIPTR